MPSHRQLLLHEQDLRAQPEQCLTSFCQGKQRQIVLDGSEIAAAHLFAGGHVLQLLCPHPPVKIKTSLSIPSVPVSLIRADTKLVPEGPAGD